MQEVKQWPVKIMLVHPKAPFLKGEKIVIAADCAVLVNRDIRDRFESDAVIIGCPMLEDPKRMFERIKMIVAESDAKLEVYTMEVPCCHALHLMVEKAKEEHGKQIDTEKCIVRVSGAVEPYSKKIDESMIEAERRAHRGH
jgi:hypothetical protein